MDISEDYQTKLFPYAYNILGNIDDAHDVIQDVIANHIESPKLFGVFRRGTANEE